MASAAIRFKEPTVTPAEASRLVGVLEALASRPGLSDVYLYGYSDSVFNLGGDLAFARVAPLGDLKTYARLCLRAVELFHNLPCATHAIVAGKAIGGGAEAALAAEYLDMKAGGSLWLPEFRQGHFPFAGGMVLPLTHSLDDLIGGKVVRGARLSRRWTRVSLPPLADQWAELVYYRFNRNPSNEEQNG